MESYFLKIQLWQKLYTYHLGCCPLPKQHLYVLDSINQKSMYVMVNTAAQ